MMAPFDFKYQNPSGFAFLMRISRTIVVFTPLGVQYLSKKKTNKLDCGGYSQMTPSWKLPVERTSITVATGILRFLCHLCVLLHDVSLLGY